MKTLKRTLLCSALALTVALPAMAAEQNRYAQTNFVANKASYKAGKVEPTLISA
jgi:hypothetical protein